MKTMKVHSLLLISTLLLSGTAAYAGVKNSPCNSGNLPRSETVKINGEKGQRIYVKGITETVYWTRNIENTTDSTCKVTMDGKVFVKPSIVESSSGPGADSVYSNVGETFYISPLKTMTLKAVTKGDLGYSRASTPGKGCAYMVKEEHKESLVGGCNN